MSTYMHMETTIQAPGETTLGAAAYELLKMFSSGDMLPFLGYLRIRWGPIRGDSVQIL